MQLKTVDPKKNSYKNNVVRPISEYAAKSSSHQAFLPADRTFVPDSRYFNTRFDAEMSVFWLNMRADCPAKFTPELVQAFVALKEHELERFRTSVTDWEFNEYAFHL